MASSGAPFFGVVYADQYGSIQNAIAAAGSNGHVIIPATYSGSDQYANPLGIRISDQRPGKMALNAATGAAARPPLGMFPFWASLSQTYGSSGSKTTYAAGQWLGIGCMTSPGPLGQ